MTIELTQQDYFTIGRSSSIIVHSWFWYYYFPSDPNKALNSLIPLASIASIAAGSYCYATNTNPKPLQKTVMYGFLCGSTLYTAYEMYQKPENSTFLGTLLITNLLRYFLITNGISSLVEKFVTDKVQMPIGNTDIQLTGGATSMGVQWSSTDDPATDANLTGNTDESESTT